MDFSNKDMEDKKSLTPIELDGGNERREEHSVLNHSVTRRELLHSAGLLYATSALVSHNLAQAGSDDDVTTAPILPPSPATAGWGYTLPRHITYLKPRDLSPIPQETANIAGGEAGRLPHPFWAQVTNAQNLADFKSRYYELFAAQFNWVFHPNYPAQPIWGYQDSAVITKSPDMPSAIVAANYGHPLLCRIWNKLPAGHVGFGAPYISTHLHNLHTGSESDGFPGDWYSSTKYGPTLTKAGGFKDHLYLNLKADFTNTVDWPPFGSTGLSLGDPTEALGTLFYHDHTENFTGPNVYRGLSGFYLLFDELDSGNEKDPNNDALHLPSGDYDYPFNICDRHFDYKGKLLYDQLNPEGTLGDKIVINGRIKPVWRVSPRKYRMRILNSGPSRFYNLAIVNANNVIQPFVYIANDGNLLPKPIRGVKSVSLGVAERADIVMDFKGYPNKTELFLVNRLTQISTRKPDKVVLPGERIMKIVIDYDMGIVDDFSEVRDYLRPLPADKFSLSEDEIKRLNVPVRRFEFEHKSGLWVINDKIFDVTKPTVKVKKGTAEVWELVNDSGGWEHPIHIHFEEGRILSKFIDGVKVPVPLHEQGRKDVYVLEPNSITRVYLEFRDCTGKYVMHCHNMIHEDHAMMLRWDIVEGS